MSVVELPEVFCWTRFGSEAGEGIQGILARKERERRDNSGLFTWGIGNSVAPGIAELVRRSTRPEVLFSPIKSRPRKIDVSPSIVVRWRRATTLTGVRVELPETSLVTSGMPSIDAAAPHYALVCAAESPLQLSDWGRLRFGELRNLRSGKPLGPSQVTAVVQREAGATVLPGPEYVVALRTALADPYFLRLEDPQPLEHPIEAQAA